MVNKLVQVAADETGVEQAFNSLYYYIVRNISVGQEHPENVVLNNTILTFDAVESAFYYSRQCFRSLADRVITGIPTKIDAEDSELGKIGSVNDINVGDAYSKYYRDLVERAVRRVDRRLSDEEILRVDTLKETIKRVEQEIVDIQLGVENDWKRYAEIRGLKEEGARDEYEYERVDFLTRVRIGSRIKSRQEEIAEALLEVRDIRRSRYETVEQAQLAEVLRELYLVERQPSYPNNPRFEADHGLTPLQLADCSALGNDLGDMVQGPRIWANPSVDRLGKFVSEAPSEMEPSERSFAVKHRETHEFNMERRWKVRDSARKFIFFKVRTTATKVEKVKKSLKQIVSIKVSFTGIEEVMVVRDRWFISSIFEYEDVKAVLKENPDLKRRLSYVINTLILVRGISVELNFDEQTASDEFKSLELSGSTRFSLFGIKFSLGGNGTAGHTHVVDTTSDTKKVVIRDHEDHWRVVGFRVEKLIDSFNDEELAAEDDATNVEWPAPFDTLGEGPAVPFSVRDFSGHISELFEIEVDEG